MSSAMNIFFHSSSSILNLIQSVCFSRFLIESGPKALDVCYKVEGGSDTTTPLIEAAVDGEEELVNFLITKGASVNFPKVRLVEVVSVVIMNRPHGD